MNKAELAPYSLHIKPKHIELSNYYTKTFIVIKFPSMIYFGFLSYYLSDPSIKVRVKTNPLKFDITKPLKREIHLKQQDLNKEKDPTVAARLNKELNEYRAYVNELVHSNDKTINVYMTFTISTTDKDDMDDKAIKLRNQLNQQGFLIKDISLMQEELFKLTSPLFIKSGINEDLLYNYGVPVTTSAFATMWGYNFDKLNDRYGFLLGNERVNGGLIRFNPFLYLDDEKSATVQNRIDGNIVIFGASGTGKTTTLYKIVRYFIREHTKLIWIDPENKNVHACDRFGGEFVQWGIAGNQINVFDLKPLSSDESDDINRYDTKIAIANCIDDFKRIMLFYHEHLLQDVSEALNEADELIIQMYHRKGIDANCDFSRLSSDNYPILADLADILEEHLEDCGEDNYRFNLLTRLKSYLKPLLYSNGHFFNGHTTIKDSHMLCFGTKSLKDKSLGIRNALYFLMFKYAWGICTSDKRSAFVLDEGQEMILEGDAAKEVSTYNRRSRKYENTFVYASQDPSDLNSSVMVNGVEMKAYGTAIMNNSSYKIIMGLKKQAVDSISGLMTLNDIEKHCLDMNNNEMKKGDALLVAGSNKMMIKVYASPKERIEMDPNSVHNND